MHWWSHRTGGGVASAMARAIASDIIIPGNEFVRTCMYVSALVIDKIAASQVKGNGLKKNMLRLRFFEIFRLLHK